MSLKNLKQNITDVNPFPNDKNVRIKIEGLAVCKFDRNEDNPNFVYFPRFVDFHELIFSVVRRDSNGNVDVIKKETIIPRDISSIIIVGSDAKTPDSYQHPPNTANGEYGLDKLLHLSNLHGVRFALKSVDLPEITTLKMETTSFYTYETAQEYRVNLNGIEMKQDTFTKIIGGYIQCNTGTINISIGNNGKPPFYDVKLPIIENGNLYQYQIAFTNHCEGDDSECQSVISGGGTDVKFLYKMLKPDARPIDLVEIITIKSPNVAACLPIEIEPFN